MTPSSHGAQRFMARTLIAIGLTAFGVGHAYAGPPSPANSICPPAVFLTPTGNCCFDVIVRDFAGNPIAGSSVFVDFGTCAVIFCPAQPPGITVVGNGVLAVTNAVGVAHFCICATFTGACTATISADGVILCTNIPLANDCSPTANRTSCWGQLKIHYR